MLDKLITIVGPTSSGKTSVALKLCELYGGAIVSADSRQTVKTMDIGTGKMPLTSGEINAIIEKRNKYWKINNINVFGYDLIAPDENFSAWHFAKYARNKINELLELGTTPLLVGGTGFYVDATLGKVKLSSKTTSVELRDKLNTMNFDELVDYFTSLNIKRVTDMQNRVRVQRAIENHLNSETSEMLPKLYTKEVLEIGLTANREYLYHRVDDWVDVMWQNGIVEETAELIKEYGEQNPKLNGVVYKTVVAFLNGKISREESIQRTKFDLHAYIRRQQTWFKKNQNIVWFDISHPDNPNKIIEHVSSFLKC